MPRIYFFKRSTQNDAYQKLFEQYGWNIRFIPAVTFEFVITEELKSALSNPGAFSGCIITSQRAAEALEDYGFAASEAFSPWQDKPMYAVGPATARAARKLGFSTLGEEAGSAIRLAQRIILNHEDATKPLLFLCGSSRRDELPDRLAAQNVPFQECIVYHTHSIQDLKIDTYEAPDVVAFFSPSGVKAVSGRWPESWKETGCLAIGERTAYAISQAGLNLTATSLHPTPEGLLKAIQTTNPSFIRTPDPGH